MTTEFSGPPVVVNISGVLYIGGISPIEPYDPERFRLLTEEYENRPKDFRLEENKNVRTFEVISSREPNKKYTVTVTQNGQVICECKGFQFRKNCKHCDQIKKQLK